MSEYIIILFELLNVSATFQTYINWVLVKLINIFYIIYLNNLLIFSENLDWDIKAIL